MNMQGVLQTAPSWWMGMRVLRLASVPEKLPDTLAGEALQRCLQGGLSLELCLMTGETAGRLEIALIVRAQGASLYQLQDRLEKYSDMPEVGWFMEHCIDSFAKTLDELG